MRAFIVWSYYYYYLSGLLSCSYYPPASGKFWYTYQSKHLCQNAQSLVKSTKKCVGGEGGGEGGGWCLDTLGVKCQN